MKIEKAENLFFSSESLAEFLIKKVPGFDNDGVISDTRSLVLDFVNKQLKTNYVDRDIRDWNQVSIWAKESGWTSDKALELDNYVWYDPEFLKKAKLIPGARKLTDFLLHEKVPFKIITSRLPHLVKSTFEWYEENLPEIPKENIIIWPIKEMAGGIFKSFNINRYNLGVFFEDVPEQALDIVSHTDARVFLLSNIGTYDGMHPGKLCRIGGENGNCANLDLIVKNLQNHSVAQY